jgi:hypothetical protein
MHITDNFFKCKLDVISNEMKNNKDEVYSQKNASLLIDSDSFITQPSCHIFDNSTNEAFKIIFSSKEYPDEEKGFEKEILEIFLD